MNTPTTTIPGPKGHFLLGSIPAIQQDRAQFLIDLQREYGNIARIRLGPSAAVLVFHPDDIQRVLLDNQKNYTKQTRTYDSLRLLAGNGLITSDGDLWLRQRRLMQPTFHRKVINDLSEMIVQQTQETIDHMENAARNNQTIDISHETMNLTLGVATQALFSSRVVDLDGSLGESIHFLLTDTAFRFEHPFYPPLWFPAKRNRKFNDYKKRLDDVIYGIIDRRRENIGQTGDLLDLMMQARLEDEGTSGSKPQGMTEKQLHDELVVLFLAGHETTSLCLCWTLYLLTKHPDVEARMRRELVEVLDGRLPTLEDLPRLEYTRMVRDESLRLYPPAWLMERKAVKEDVLGGYLIPAGTTLGITQYVTHRHPKFWENPVAFDPERFSPKRSAGRHDFAYFPFGGGQRQCIGKNLALLETHLALAMFLQRFHFELLPGWQVKTEPELSLRLKGGLPMRLELL